MNLPTTFRRFKIFGDQISALSQETIDLLSARSFKESDPAELQCAWCGGEHVFDAVFSLAHNVFNEALLAGLRIDTNQVPASIKRAMLLQEEAAVAAANPSGFISKAQKPTAREACQRQLDAELASGKHRRSKLVPWLFDLPSHTLYTSATGGAVYMLLDELANTFGGDAYPLTAGWLAADALESQGHARFDALRPTRFATACDVPAEQPPYPWISKSAHAKDFLGNEFLLWLWYRSQQDNEVIQTSVGDCFVLLDRFLEMECAYGQRGRDVFRGDSPVLSPEARDALRLGKMPRKATLSLAIHSQAYEFTFSAETFALSQVRLPEVESFDSPRVLLEERITQLRDLTQALDALYKAFLDLRASDLWPSIASDIGYWTFK